MKNYTIIAVVYAFSLGCASLAYAAGATTPTAASASSCISCSGSGAQLDQCMTQTGSESCSSGGACTAQNCPAGCTGNYFLALGSSESTNSYSSTNGKCDGKWQFCNPASDKYCGGMGSANFNTDAGGCQDQDMIDYTVANWNSIVSLGANCVGKTVAGEVVTAAGLLGAAHLGGPGAAQAVCEGGSGGADGGGTSPLQYFKNFNNTVLPSQFLQLINVSSSGSCSAAAPGAAVPGVGAAGGAGLAGGAAADPSASMMSSMMPMMMMMMMMPMLMSMMSGLTNKSSSAATTPTTTPTTTPSTNNNNTPSTNNNNTSSCGSSGGLLSALESLFNASCASTPASPSPTPATTTTPATAQEQPEEQQEPQPSAAEPAELLNPATALQPADGAAQDDDHQYGGLIYRFYHADTGHPFPPDAGVTAP